MKLKEAEDVVHQYSEALLQYDTPDGPAHYISQLSYPAEQIMQAMKLWLAHEIRNCSLTEEFLNEIGGCAASLPYFIADEEARRLNTIHKNYFGTKRTDIPEEEFMRRATAAREVNEWSTAAMASGLALRRELSEFVETVEKHDEDESRYWQRVYALAGVESVSPQPQSSDTHHPSATVQILRWIAVLPGAVLAGLLVQFPIHWAAMVIHFGDTGDSMITTAEGKGLLASMPLESLERFGYALFVPLTMITVGSRIAPRFRFSTAIVLALGLAGLVVFVFSRLESAGLQITDSSLRMVITLSLLLVSTVSAVFHARGLDKGA